MLRNVSPSYISASAMISLGGFANGYDTGSIGAMLSMSQFTISLGVLSPFILGFTVSLVMISAVIPSILSGYLADRFGRLRIISIGAGLFGIGSLLQSTAPRLAQFMAGRVVAGFGQGIYLGNISVYICEIAPVRYRGTLAGLPQFLITVGTCAGYFTCYGSVGIRSSLAWRLPLIVQCVVAIFVVLSCFLVPESPRWLILHGKHTAALQSLQRLQFPMTEAEDDFLNVEQRLSMSEWQKVTLLFTKAYRARTLLGLFVLGMIQLSGIDGVLYYAPTLFFQAGLSSETASFLASGLSGILMVVVSIPAFLLADKWGRRTSAITGGLGLSACMFLIGCLYAARAVDRSEVAKWLVIVSVFLFGVFYCATWGIVGKVYASEIQPAHTRATASCLAQGLAFFANWVVAIVTPVLLDKSSSGVYFLFGGLALVTVITLALYMPETRGRSLENIQAAFRQPSLKSFKDFFLSLVHYKIPLPQTRRVSENTAVSTQVANTHLNFLAPRNSIQAAP